MKTINGITLTGRKAKRLSDGKIFEIIVSSKDLGYFKSLIYLEEQGYDVNTCIDELIVSLNPHKFKNLTTQDLADEFIKNTPYEKAVKLKDNEGCVYCDGFGKIHIDNWRKLNNEIDREKAMKWWNNLSILKKNSLALSYFKRKPDSLTGREIEHIWNMEIVWKKSHQEEKLYTKEEVQRLIMKSHIARNGMTDPYNQIPEWVEKNL